MGIIDGRWPRFTVEALAAGFRSVHAFPMRLWGTVIGALGLFDAECSVMQPSDVDAAQAFADVATIAILQHRAAVEAQVLNEQLQYALESRVVIEQAKGMIAEREGLDMAQAFSMLRTHGRNHNLRLADVAAAIVGGTLPASALDRPHERPLKGTQRREGGLRSSEINL